MDLYKVFLSALLVLFMYVGAYSQTVHYTYDANGNRISRTIVMRSVPKSSVDTTLAKTDPLAEVYEEVLSAKSAIKIYPNPVESDLNVRIEGDWALKSFPYTLCTYQGVVLQQGTLQGALAIPMRDLASGLYLLQIRIDGTQEVWKIIKQ